MRTSRKSVTLFGIATCALLLCHVTDVFAKSHSDLISAIDVRGLRRVDRTAALAGVTLTVGQPLSPEQITENIHALWQTGFFRDVRILKEQTAGGWRIVIDVDEKPTIREVKYIGRSELSEDDVTEVVDVKPNTILNTELLKRNVEKIKELYIEKGYYLATVDFRIAPVADTASQVDVIFEITEEAKVVVRQISFVGNHSISAEEIKSKLQTREGNEISFLTQAGTYKQEFFEADMFRIQAVYYDRGYVAVKVGEPTATISRDRREIYLSVPIEEGAVYDIGNITFSGDIELKNKEGKVLVSAEQLRNRLRVHKGDLFNRTQLFEDVNEMTGAYRDHGYAYANVTPNSVLRSDPHRVDLEMQVDRGPLVYIDRIEIVGNTKTRDKVIRREMVIAEGDRFSDAKLKASKARIFQRGFFETVEITQNRGTDGSHINLTVAVKEKSTGTFQIGAGFSSVESFIATAQVSQNNFLGNGQVLSVSAQLSFGDFARQLATVQFYDPYFLDTTWSFGINGYLQQRFFRDFQRNAKGFSPTVGYPLTHDLRLSFGYTLEWIEISTGLDNGQGAQIAGLNADGRNSALNAQLTYDTRNNRLFPSSGQYYETSFEFSHPGIGSDSELSFGRTQLTARYYHELPWSFVLKLNASLGYVFGFGDQGAPISERYFPGGIYSIRGFEPRGLGPTINVAQGNDPRSRTLEFVHGGNKELVFNIEIEFPILEAAGIKGVVFVDAGNAYSEDQNFFYANTPKEAIPKAYMIGSGKEKRSSQLGGLYYSFGFGFRWFSPIGPLRFEWGIPITKKNPNDRGMIFEFTIGNFF